MPYRVCDPSSVIEVLVGPGSEPLGKTAACVACGGLPVLQFAPAFQLTGLLELVSQLSIVAPCARTGVRQTERKNSSRISPRIFASHISGREVNAGVSTMQKNSNYRQRSNFSHLPDMRPLLY